jgi:hypothetical protein
VRRDHRLDVPVGGVYGRAFKAALPLDAANLGRARRGWSLWKGVDQPMAGQPGKAILLLRCPRAHVIDDVLAEHSSAAGNDHG